MSTVENNDVVVETQAPKKTTVKKTAKKTAKKSVKKTAKKTATAKKAPVKKSAPAPAAEKKEGGVKWSEKRLAVIRGMKKIRATSPTAARTAADIAGVCGLEEKDIKHYCYYKEQLATNGYVGVAKVEDQKRLCYYLTAKGMAVGK